MPRRGENIRRRKDGRWEGRYIVSCGDRRKVCSVYARTYAEVKQKQQTARQAAREQEAAERRKCNKNSNAERDDICPVEAAEEWLSRIAATRKHATFIKYRSLYQKYLKNPLSSITFSGLTPDFFAEKILPCAEGCSGSIRKSLLSVLQMIVDYCAESCRIPTVRFTNQSPVREKKKTDIFSRSEQKRVIAHLYEEMDLCKLGIVLCLSTGLRLGEICALKWEDIDFSTGILRVDRTVQRIAVEGQDTRTRLLEGTPKTASSCREIPLSGDTMSLLKKFRTDTTYVLNGASPLDPRTYQNRLKGYLKQAGVAVKNFHVLRHTFATNCIEAGVDAKSLSEILGHSDVRITLNRYVHPSLDTKRNHMERITGIYGTYVGQKEEGA